MAKRFIDTGLFSNKWFMKLSKDAKLLWVYMFTNCDHAGIIEINEELICFQTKIKGLETVIKELSNNLISLENDYYFVIDYLEFQYPGFPNSRVRAQISAIEILKKFGLWDIENETLNYEKINPLIRVTKGLNNSYGYDNGYDNGNGNGYGNVNKKEIFIKSIIDINSENKILSETELEKFIEYWSEKSKSGKMKYEFEKTWEGLRRLKTWLSNSQKFNSGKQENRTVKLTPEMYK